MPNLTQPNNKIVEKNQDKPADPYQAPKKKPFPLLWVSVSVLLVVIIGIGLLFVTRAVLAVNSTNNESGEKVGLFEQIKHLIANPDKHLRGEEADRINILLVGIGGPGHQGAYLADTIIIASYKPSTDELATLSIPRDLYVDIPEFGWRKINNALAFGYEADYPGGGEGLLKEVIEEVTGLPIHYYGRVDFAGFRKAIDDISGIDIYIDNSFTDYEYPDYNYGYQTIRFTEGLEHMDGERALQYVRSRHGTNGEGSDFARSKRQQKVLFAIKEKIFSLESFLNPSKIVAALDDLGDHNQTDLQIWELLRLANLLQNLEANKVITKVLDNGVEGILQSETTLDGAYILTPKSGDWSEVQEVAENIFNTSVIQREEAVIEIQNSTSETGLASRTAERLQTMGYNVETIGNATTETVLSTTTIYDLSAGAKPYTVASLKNLLDAEVAIDIPTAGTETAASNTNQSLQTGQSDTDILIIIGTDQSTGGSLTNS